MDMRRGSFNAAVQDGRDVPAAVTDYCHGVTARAGEANGSANGNGHHRHSNGGAPAWEGGADELDTHENADCFRFGEFGGRYVPETLVDALDELDRVCHQHQHQHGDPVA
jgi:hypothetical protein